MNETFEIIDKLPKDDQLNMLLELLQELGGSVQVRRNQLSQYWVERMAVQLENERKQCETIKQKIKQLYHDIRVQNIAKS